MCNVHTQQTLVTSQISLNSLNSHYRPRDLIIFFSKRFASTAVFAAPKFLLVRNFPILSSNNRNFPIITVMISKESAQTHTQSMPQCLYQSMDEVNPLHPKVFFFFLIHNNPVTRCHTRNYRGNPASLGRCSSLSPDYSQGNPGRFEEMELVSKSS